MAIRRRRAETKPGQGPLETGDQKLDEALALTFPASDPPAQTQAIVHVGVQAPEHRKPGPHPR